MGESFKLNFVTNGEGILPIAEPEGFDGADFTLKQKDKGYGRDVSFAGGEVQFTFYKQNDHEFDTIMYYFETYGWESEIKLIIEKEGIDNIIGDLDFKEADTDQLTYFSCKVIQDTNRAILERRADVNVDMFNDEDIDGNAILPLTTENILVKAKPIKQASAWETPAQFFRNFFSSDNQSPGVSMTNYYYFNPSINITKSDIDDTLTFFEQSVRVPFDESSTAANNFKIIEAQNNLRDIKIDITNFNFHLETDTDEGGNGYVDFRLELRYGADYSTATQHIFFADIKSEGLTYDNTNDYTFTVPYLNRLDSVWLHFYYKVRQSTTIAGPGQNPKFEAFTTIESMDVDVVATSVAYNTIVPSIRLYDATSQVVLSTSGLSTSFPFAEVNGEMYNQRLFNGNLMRNITDRPFNISLKDISEWLPEINGDYEVQNDDTVFFGLYADFYTNTELGVFTDVRFDGYKKSFNKRYAQNQFFYGYKKYQSQKENEVENTFDVVHGESEWSILNRFVENKKEVKVGFVRDTFYIDEQRRKAIDLNDTTSTQDDDTIFIIDTLEATSDSIYEETDFLQHTYDDTTGYLKLANTGTFSFVLIGLAVGETFEILGGDPNAGVYTIIEVAERHVIINNGTGTLNNNDARITTFKYIVSISTAPYISWSNEGFNYIDNAIPSDNFANLKYTVKRNIRRFYNQYLATANFWTNKAIKNTEYKNNGDLSLSYEGIQTIESDPFTPSNPILSPYTHEVTLVTDFNTYKQLEDNVKLQRGYIRVFDANEHPIKIYPQEMTFVNSAELGELTIFGEEKNQPSLINIIYGNIGYLTINDEYRTTKIIYKNEGEIFYIFDVLGKLLYSPVFWHKITVNDASPNSKEQLIQWLTLIS